MRLSNVLPTTAAVLHLLAKAQAKAVFAHYMVGTVTQEHAQTDIDDVIDIGLDGFALNIGDPTEPYVSTTLSYLYEHANGKDFKLFVSMDLSASGAACAAGRPTGLQPTDYQKILSTYFNNQAAYLGPNGLPMMSTYTAGGFSNTTFDTWRVTYFEKMGGKAPSALQLEGLARSRFGGGCGFEKYC